MTGDNGVAHQPVLLAHLSDGSRDNVPNTDGKRGSASTALANAQAECADRNTPPDRSIVTCSEVIRGDARAAWAYISRGNAYRAKGDNDRAIADHTKAIEMKRLQR